LWLSKVGVRAGGIGGKKKKRTRNKQKKNRKISTRNIIYNMTIEEPEIKLPTSTGSLKKQESSRKKHLFLLY